MKDLTVIVTIRNRRNTLPRAMSYYKDFPAKVIFLDSTQGFPYNAHDVEPNEYRHVPGKKYVQKISECLDTVDTKYCTVVCDDDFLVKDSINECITFLNNNEHYAACRGQEVALFDNFFSVETLDYLVDHKTPLYSTVAKDRVLRMWSVFNNVGGNPHNIMRTETYKEILDFHSANDQFNTINIYDKTFSFVLASLGNIAVLPLFYIVRSEETRATSLKLSDDVEEEIGDWKPEIQFKDHFLLCDTKPLEQLINCSRGFIEDLFTDICSNSTRQQHLVDLLQNNKVGLPFDYTPVINEYPLLFRYGTGGDIFGTEGFKDSFVKTEEVLSDLYPVYKEKNLHQLHNIVSIIKEFPL